MDSICVFWFRRDLRLKDNTALNLALSNSKKVLPIFIFDEEILRELPPDDARLTFIYDFLFSIDKKLKKNSSSILCLKGKPIEVWKELLQSYPIKKVYFNKDYEPYARSRDAKIEKLLISNGIEFLTLKTK